MGPQAVRRGRTKTVTGTGRAGTWSHHDAPPQGGGKLSPQRRAWEGSPFTWRTVVAEVFA